MTKKHLCACRTEKGTTKAFKNQPSPIDIHLGAQIPRLREQLGYSRYKLVAVLDIVPELID